MRARRGALRRAGAAVAILAIALPCARSAYGWDSATHRLITRLAVGALPPSALKTAFTDNERALERFSVEPDTVLKRKYGREEARRHYVDLEWFGNDPFAGLNPDLRVMRERFGEHTLERSGALPWTIEEVAGALAPPWRRGDCRTVIRLSGYLAHYVGDASQPLHTTIHFDGYRRDRGIHARFERAVDKSAGTLGRQARSEVHVGQVNGVWSPVVGEIRQANGLVAEVIRDDRAARDHGAFRGPEYRRALLAEGRAMLAHELARAASVLGSLWLYEWQRAGRPAVCEAQAFSGPR